MQHDRIFASQGPSLDCLWKLNAPRNDDTSWHVTLEFWISYEDTIGDC